MTTMTERTLHSLIEHSTCSERLGAQGDWGEWSSWVDRAADRLHLAIPNQLRPPPNSFIVPGSGLHSGDYWLPATIQLMDAVLDSWEDE